MRRLLSVRLIALLAAVIVCTSAIAAHADGPEGRRARFDLPEQPLADALRAVGAQTSVNVVFEPSSVRGKRAPTLRGEYTVQEALGLLLDGTGLRVRLTTGGSYVIERFRSGASGIASGDFQLALVTNAEETPEQASGRNAGRNEEKDAEVIVEDTRIKPFSTPSVDLPRSRDDVQPYYIIDSETIQRYSALNLEDFLKKRLTMNTHSRTDLEVNASVLIARSTVNLRGLGQASTLILINGRRPAPVQIPAGTAQSDINGIPLSSIERIEVLPTSASGIYGGNALGGVVNIITKRNFRGGELQMSYFNPADTDAARKTVSGSWGFSLENGRTQVMVSGEWFDASYMTRGDREFVWARRREIVLRNAPSLLQGSSFPPLASTPNIRSLTGEPLVLDNDVPLNATITHIPVGFGPQADVSNLYQALLANAGSYNLQPAPTSQWEGTRQPLGAMPDRGSAVLSVRRRMSERLELFADLSYAANRAIGLYNPWTGGTFMSPTAPANPFQQTIYVSVPNALDVEQFSYSISRSAVLGALFDWSHGWRTEADFSWSDNRYQYASPQVDPAYSTDVGNGVTNILVDTLTHQPDLAKYLAPLSSSSSYRAYDLSLRGSGPLPVLPWGTPQLTFGLQYRKGVAPQRTFANNYPLSPSFSTVSVYFRRDQTLASGYAETLVPLAPAGRWTGVKSLDLQLAARAERYEVETGTQGYQLRPATGQIFYMQPNIGGQPFDATTSYTSRHGTIGLRYRPVESVGLRISRGTAFLPPSPPQLVQNPEPGPPQPVTDPLIGGPPVLVPTQGGGNPNLIPQNSKSFNAGIVWAPVRGRLEGLRVNLEYYRIEQFDVIGQLFPQEIVDNESRYPGRVIRDPVTGQITLIDTSLMNLYRNETAGWDVTVDYSLSGAAGTFTVYAAGTLIDYERRQSSFTSPVMDYANFVADGGPLRERANVELTWGRHGWHIGWNAQYYGHYKQRGSAGGPSEYDAIYVQAQGGENIPSQAYHNVFFSMGFPGKGGGGGLAGHLLEGLTLALGVDNVFDKVPPYDAFETYSRYGSLLLRSYWVRLNKRF